MQQPKPVLKTAMAQKHRLPTRLRVTIGRINENAEDSAKSTGTLGTYYSDATSLVPGGAPADTYTTWEPGRWVCGGNTILSPGYRGVEQGFVGYPPSLADGTFNISPAIYVALNQVYTVEGLAFTFDPSCDDWPETIHILATRDGQVITDEDASPDGATWAWGGVIGAVDYIEITFVKMRQGGRRPRLQGITLGDGIDLSGRLLEATCKRDVDFMALDNPFEEFDFTIQNYDKAFDPENPSGVWAKLLDRNPVNVEFEQLVSRDPTWEDCLSYTWGDVGEGQWGDLPEEHKETVPAGLFYLKSKSSEKNGVARFPCVSMLGLCTKTYYKGPLNGGSLYSLAENILLDMELPETTAGDTPWQIWEGLKNATTKAPLPIDTGINLLKLIANAGGCVLYTDRQGVIQITPRTFTQPRALTYDDMAQVPDILINSTISRIAVRAYSYKREKEASVAHEETYNVSGSYRVNVEFGGAYSNVTVAATGGTVSSSTIYPRYMVCTLRGNGEVTLTVTGIRIGESYSIVSSSSGSAAPNATGRELDNPLITSTERAEGIAAALWTQLTRRRAYEFAGRGQLDIDPTDTVTVETPYGTAEGVIRRHEWTVDTTLRDKIRVE